MKFFRADSPQDKAVWIDADAVSMVTEFSPTETLLIVAGQLLRVKGHPGDILIDIAQAKGVENVTPVPF